MQHISMSWCLTTPLSYVSDFQGKSDTQNTFFPNDAPFEINLLSFALKKRKYDTDWKSKYLT